MDKRLIKYVDQYVCEATEHRDATEQGDAPRANRNYHRLIKTRNRIISLGENGIDALLGLLKHENPGVRCWVATHLIQTHPEKAIPVLEHVAEGDGLCSLSAEIVLQEWRNGTLKVP